MTTVAYSSGVLAFDSKITGNDGYTGWGIKGRKTSKFLMAGCGSFADMTAFMDWMQAGGVVADKKLFGIDRKIEMSAIVVNKKGHVYFYEDYLYPFQIDAPFHAIGSGSSYAIGAMAFGATAVQAIKIASKWDNGTGGLIRQLSWEK